MIPSHSPYRLPRKAAQTLRQACGADLRGAICSRPPWQREHIGHLATAIVDTDVDRGRELDKLPQQIKRRCRFRRCDFLNDTERCVSRSLITPCACANSRRWWICSATPTFCGRSMRKLRRAETMAQLNQAAFDIHCLPRFPSEISAGPAPSASRLVLFRVFLTTGNFGICRLRREVAARRPVQETPSAGNAGSFRHIAENQHFHSAHSSHARETG